MSSMLLQTTLMSDVRLFPPLLGRSSEDLQAGGGVERQQTAASSSSSGGGGENTNDRSLILTKDHQNHYGIDDDRTTAVCWKGVRLTSWRKIRPLSSASFPPFLKNIVSFSRGQVQRRCPLFGLFTIPIPFWRVRRFPQNPCSKQKIPAS